MHVSMVCRLRMGLSRYEQLSRPLSFPSVKIPLGQVEQPMRQPGAQVISGGLEKRRIRFGRNSMLADEVGLVQVTGAENATGNVDVVLMPLQHMHAWHFSVSFGSRRYKEARGFSEGRFLGAYRSLQKHSASYQNQPEGLTVPGVFSSQQFMNDESDCRSSIECVSHRGVLGEGCHEPCLGALRS
jgi:hypothetical protein